MKFQNKIILCILVSFIILISSSVAFADEAPAMELVENGTVSGDAQVIASNPWGKTSGSLEYTIPDNVEEIKSVNVVVSSYSGSGAPTYALYSNITLNTKNGLEILAYDDLSCDIPMTNDPIVYIINNHTTKQYSDYQSFFNITDSVKDLSPGDTIKISVENTRKDGYSFDGRVKLIALTFAYDDGDDDEINYWLNVGQSWTQSTRSNLIKTKDFDGEYDEVIFEDIALSSYNAICKINGKYIYDPIYEKTGGYFIDDIWNVTDNFIVGQDTNFTYRASSSGYGSFKSNVQLLKTIKNYLNVKATITPQYKDTIFAGVSNNLTMDVYSNHDVNAVVKLYNNEKLVYSDNVSLTGGTSKKLYYIDPTIRPITADTVNGAKNKHENYTLVIEDNDGNILNTTDVSYSVLYNGNLGKDFAYPASNATVNRFYNITGDIVILTQKDSDYVSSSETHHESTFNVDSLDVCEGLLYIQYNWDKIASNDFNSWIITFNNQAITPIANYRDQSNLGTYGRYGYGLVVYNVTDLVKTGNNNLVLDKNAGGCAVYPSTLVLLTNNNESRTYKLVYIAENADLLSKQANLATGSYTFMDVESNNFINSTLYVFAAGGESGEGNIIVNENLFNNVWNKTKNSIDYYTIDMNLFTLDSNTIYFQATGSTILALQDILVIEIEKITPELNVKAESIMVGENLTIEVTLPEDAAGDVRIDDMVVSLVKGKASFVISDLAVGNYTFTVKYSGDDKYNPTNKTSTITVYDKEPEKVTPVLYVDAASEIVVGDNLVIDVTLPGDATGDVSIDDKVVSLSNGKASFTISDLAVGSHTFTVKYSGDLKYNPTANKTTVNVKKPTKITPILCIDAEDIVVGEDLIISVDLPEDATGEVSIGSTVVSLKNGIASFTISDLAVGSYTFTVKYSGDDKYNPTSNKTSVNVKDPVKITPVLYINAKDTILVGEDLVIDVTLPGDATGDVSIGDRVVSLKEGKASFTISGLDVGSYTFTVKYSGNDKYNPASNKTIVEVNKVPKVTPVMYLESKDIVVGENSTIDVTLPKDATGDVSIGITHMPLKEGKASFTISGLDVGSYTFTVKYSGDDKYNPVNNKTTINVKENKTINISVPDVEKFYKGSERLNVYVTDLKGNPINNKTVTIFINGATYTRTTNDKGQTSIALGLNSGVYNVTTTVDNQSVISLVMIKATVNGSDVTKIYRNATQYYATFRDSNGNYLAEGTKVRFNINGVFYDRQISGNKGQAKLNLNLEQGDYILTAMNLVTGENAANNIKIIPKIVENKDLTKYFRNESQYTVKVLGDDGKPAGAGVTVKFNINGVFYERKTNASGIAKLSINLNPGDYVITAEYGGCRVSNNIKVLPILSASDLTKKYGEKKPFEAKLLNGQGKPYPNQSVQFNINGVFYTRTTDNTGVARLNINLQPGQYIITSMYNGASISNTVKVTS